MKLAIIHANYSHFDDSRYSEWRGFRTDKSSGSTAGSTSTPSATDRNDGSSGNEAREGVKLPDGESGGKSLPGGSGASSEGREGCGALYD